MGIIGGWLYSIYVLNIDWHNYLIHSQHYVRGFDVFAGVFKSLFFGAAIALISCYRGFNCDPGAEGVGRAATTAFVHSFVVILMLDAGLAIGLESVYLILWPEGPRLL
jgi:phospholipid/cholesterol/gamma-HCH transport system permease protein